MADKTLASSEIPVLMKHMTLAIFKEDRHGPRAERFIRAFTIACGRLRGLGYLDVKGKDTSPTSLVLTDKGRVLEAKHRKERGSAPKSIAFDRLYAETF